MNYPTPEQVLFIHARLISETGGAHGVRDVGLLESAVARPQATFEGRLLYPDVFTQAAALMDSLVNNHPFVDGNKRTGITAAGLFLLLNGFKLTASQAVVESITLGVATKDLDIEELAGWFKKNTQNG